MQEIHTPQLKQRISMSTIKKGCLEETLSCAPLNLLSQLSDGSGSQTTTDSLRVTSRTNLETPAKYKHFRQPPKAYRRYEYTRRHAIRLVERCSKFLHNYNIPDFGDVDIYLIKFYYGMAFDEEFQLSLPDETFVEERTCNTFTELISQIATNNKELSVVVTPIQNHKLFQSLMEDNKISNNTVFVCRNDEEMLKYKENIKHGIVVVQKENIDIQIGKLLERLVLKNLKDIYTAMDTVLKSFQETNDTTMVHLPQNEASGTDNGKNSTERKIQCVDGVPGKGHYQNTSVVEFGCLNPDRNEVIQLRREIMGIFKRSDAPKHEYPPSCQDTCDKRLCEEIEMWLNKEVDVQAYGFRFGKLFIILKSNRMPNVGKLEEYLKMHNVTEFVIREESEVGFSDITTGSCVRPDFPEKHLGTLGGFVQWTRNQEQKEHKIMCAITAKHVVQRASKLIHVCVSDTTEREIGTVLQQSVPEDGLDISAAEIRKELVDCCERKFKDIEGNLFYGELYDCTADGSEGLPVYIWGAKSGLGRGILPFQQLKKTEHYLYIEDMEKKPFCQAGDSGSVMCADLPEDSNEPTVKVLAILSGQKLPQCGTVCKCEYGAVKLINGLQELGERCTGYFELYTSESDINPCCSNHSMQAMN